ncbi:SlyX family protein [Marinomonas balearica]|uniref:Protein SlyX homolog n=1 Tax=Marinomonas balearica TaxID=491947 RepID=A0A4R6M4W7_9GAMM|nr:SlyX family protein [Marinomonas balearica]TDO96371.1 SlyX protein [Marinomonas balearica]
MKKTMNTSELEQHVYELEFKLQYQEDTIESLNNEIANHQKEISLLKEQMQWLAKRIESQKEQQSNINISNERPPHY